MIVKRDASALWCEPLPADLPARLDAAIDRGLDACNDDDPRIHFRADDVGVPGRQFDEMLGMFRARRAPLSLAVVPAWLTPARWEVIRREYEADGELWAWHQHGWRHVSHAVAGRKGEFGDDRHLGDLSQDLRKGRDRLRGMLGGRFAPVFTPPWNRMGAEAMRILARLGFRAVSRTPGAEPAAPDGMADFPVHCDLHTRKEDDPVLSLERLLAELERGVGTGLCGIMLHHQRMNGRAASFLDELLASVTRSPRLRAVHFGHLLPPPASIPHT